MAIRGCLVRLAGLFGVLLVKVRIGINHPEINVSGSGKHQHDNSHVFCGDSRIDCGVGGGCVFPFENSQDVTPAIKRRPSP